MVVPEQNSVAAALPSCGKLVAAPVGSGATFDNESKSPHGVLCGDAQPVGERPLAEAHVGTEIVEFSPTEELQKTMEVVTRNMEGASA